MSEIAEKMLKVLERMLNVLEQVRDKLPALKAPRPPKPPLEAAVFSEDVERLYEHGKAIFKANGHKPMKNPGKQKDAIRKMIEKDRESPEIIRAGLDFISRDKICADKGAWKGWADQVGSFVYLRKKKPGDDRTQWEKIRPLIPRIAELSKPEKVETKQQQDDVPEYLENKSDAIIKWIKALDLLEEWIDAENFKTWIKPLKPLGCTGINLYLAAPNNFIQSWARRNYYEQIEEAINTGLDKGEDGLGLVILCRPIDEEEGEE